MNIDTFVALRNYAKGKITKDELLDSDKLFSYMREDRNTPGQSVLSIEFRNKEEFLRAVGLQDYDINTYLSITSPYSDYEFFDYYSTHDDFMEGYGFYHQLDDENNEILSQISKAILPMKVNFDDDEYRRELSEKLMTNFKKETSNIVDDYRDEQNISLNTSMNRGITKEMDDYFNELGLDVDDNGFKITVADLISLYIQESSIHLPLKELLSNIFSRKNAPGGWDEDWYSYKDDNDFDSVRFNQSAYSNLNKILDEIEDLGVEEGVDINDFTAMTSRITKNFNQGEYYVLPKDVSKETRFKIEGFNFPSMKVSVVLQKGLKQRIISLSEQNFYNLLYQPSLFSLDEI